MERIVVANQKGGVGKTTVVINLAACLARKGRRVLVVDMDRQANATAWLGARAGTVERSVAHVLLGEAKLEDIIIPTQTENIWLAPASEDLGRADLQLVSTYGREFVLDRALGKLTTPFDYVFIDTSPYLGILSVNAMVAARHVLVPVAAEYLPIVGLKALNDALQQLQQNTGATARILGYLVTMFDKRLSANESICNVLAERFGPLVFQTQIRINSNFKSAPSQARNIFELEEGSKKNAKGTEDFEALADEFAKRLEAQRNAAAA
jgi:chromosome partitioning protein